jgi:UDP-N-acetylglucosamine--N-acetylmuramyl-(pentapeptide) pyrophosphoryl-undecaprenol N-acetylglucosamine transferase
MNEVFSKVDSNAFEITMQTKSKPKFAVKDAKSFFDNLPEVLAESHLVISRAGANAVFEHLYAARPAIYVPIAGSKREHQLLNARYVANHDFAYLIEQNPNAASKLIELLNSIVADKTKLTTMHTHIKSIPLPDSKANFEKILDNLV